MDQLISALLFPNQFIGTAVGSNSAISQWNDRRMNGLTREGTAEHGSRDQILNKDRKNWKFKLPYSLANSIFWNGDHTHTSHTLNKQINVFRPLLHGGNGGDSWRSVEGRDVLCSSEWNENTPVNESSIGIKLRTTKAIPCTIHPAKLKE